MAENGASTANPRLSVERVLDAALAIIDTDGLDKLSMRRLGPPGARKIIVDPAAAGSSAAEAATRLLHTAIADASIAADDVVACADLVADFVSGAALAAASPAMTADDRRRADHSLTVGLDVVTGGLRARAR